MGQEPLVELLAPAGDRESFYGAIHAGADAVYLGGSRFSARAYADNFSMEELLECIRYAHLWGRKVYLALNTLIKESELAEACDSVKPCYEAGLDGVIVQDIGLLAMLRRRFPGMELHASTQMTLASASGAALLKRMGACRIVPARELSLEEIKYIKQQTGLAVEAFVHGAMCYCYSGQCLFSSMLGGRSGNRGRCAQPCRLPYKIDDMSKKQSGGHLLNAGFPLSLKDMCTLEHIPKLIEAGIDSFKIEGRMKKPEYVAGVTAIYRKYIDLYYRTRENPSEWGEGLKEDMEELQKLYIRSEMQDGYYFKHNGREMITLDSSAYSGTDDKLLAKIRDQYLTKRPSMPIFLKGTFLTGNLAQVTLALGEASEEPLSVTVVGDMVQKAQKQPITLQNVEKQLGKLGDSIFRAGKIEVKVDKDAFYALGAINELRREAVRKLEDLLIVRNGLTVWRNTEENDFLKQDGFPSYDLHPCSREPEESHRPNKQAFLQGSVLSLRTTEQLSAVLEWIKESASPLRIYLDADMLLSHAGEALRMCHLLKDCTKGDMELAISLPCILRKRDDAFLKKLFALMEQEKGTFAGVQVRSLDGLGLWKQLSGKIYGDAGLYLWNKEALKAWMPLLSGVCMPLELTGREQRELLTDDAPIFEKIIYGRIPMMITANCVAKTVGQCRMEASPKEGGILDFPGRAGLIDRYRKTFPVEINCLHCFNIIYNSVPLSLHGELEKWKEKALLRLDFTLEDKEETLQVLDFYESVKESPFSEYTTGHERHGVE